MRWHDNTRRREKTAECGPFEITIDETHDGVHLTIDVSGRRIYGEYIASRDVPIPAIDMAVRKAETFMLDFATKMVKDLAGS